MKEYGGKRMKTKIAIGSLLVIFMLVSLPSISASTSQINTSIEPKITEDVGRGFPLLRLFAYGVLIFRLERGEFWLALAGPRYGRTGEIMEIKHPIFLIRCLPIFIRAGILMVFLT